MHIECFSNVQDVINAIHQVKGHGMKCGIAIKPETSVESLSCLVNELDFVLVMTVSPGFGGQRMREECLVKVKALKKQWPYLNIEVDGGITLQNVHLTTEAGADWIVSGTGICASTDQKQTIALMKQKVAKY
jgi:ribulose-phosphate 3-epimerase